MRAHSTPLAIAGVMLMAWPIEEASAQLYNVGPTVTRPPIVSRSIPNTGVRPSGRLGGAALGTAIGIGAGILMALPPPAAGRPAPPPPPDFYDRPRGPPRQEAQRPPSRQTARRATGVPPAGETRMVSDEVVIELRNTATPTALAALHKRFRLEPIESRPMRLSGTTFYRWRIADRRNVADVVRALENSNAVVSAQPNYTYKLQQPSDASAGSRATTPVPAADTASASALSPEGAMASAIPGPQDLRLASPLSGPPGRNGDPAQYELTKLRVTDAHRLATGDNILVAVIDSGVDANHPDLSGAVTASFNATGSAFAPHSHGTAIAALVAGRGRILGTAPSARVLSARAFDPANSSAEGTTFSILQSLDWSVEQGARIINMSFAGPADPAMVRMIDAIDRKGILMVAAAGNDGATSPPLYPAAYDKVIAVTATDSEDRLFNDANRGRHIAVAAPGVDMLVAAPEGRYAISSGTSYAAAEVSGIIALMLQARRNLPPQAVRVSLQATARDLGKPGPDQEFGAGLVDAYRALTEETPKPRLSGAVSRR